MAGTCAAGKAITAIGVSGSTTCAATGVTYTRILVVHPRSTAAAGGTALLAAASTANDMSADGPVLIVVEPGTYDLGGTGLVLDQGVDLRGSGEDLTAIKYEVPGSAVTAVQISADTVSDLSITAADLGSNGAVALDNQAGTGPSLVENVKLTAVSAGGQAGTAAIEATGDLRAVNIATSAQYIGLQVSGADVTVMDSVDTSGFSAGISGGGTLTFVGSDVGNGVAGGNHCFASYTSSFVALSSTCT